MRFRNLTKRLIRKPAETLVEVIVAIFVVATGSAAATTLIVTAIQSNTFSRDNLTGLNLAVEGLEAMRNIRDTNWLRFGYDKENCWNLKPGSPSGTDCTVANNLIAEGTYTIDLNPQTYAWTLTPVAAALDLGNDGLATNDGYMLGFTDVTSGADTDNNGNNNDDRDLYVTNDFVLGTLTALGFSDTGDSRFHRMIEISYSDALPPEGSEVMEVRSLVQWRDSITVHRVSLSTSLTNYFKVKTS